jgi:glycosyltransferase involved in cell wall biosynthesis
MWIERRLERFVLSRANLVAAVNEDNRTFALSFGTAPSRTTVFPYGNLLAPAHIVDPRERRDAGELLAEFGLTGRPFLMCVSRLEPVKMPDHAIRVLTLVRKSGIDTDLLLVGAGRMRAELEELARREGVAEHTFFAGERDQDWLSTVMPKAAAVLSPLTGRALAEAALAAAPTVAYDLDWQIELVRSGETGELVPAGDVEAMARAATMFLRDPALARQMGARLRARALETMDPVRLDEHERTEYTRLLAR